MFALVVNNAIQAVGRLPDSARRLDSGQWVLGLPTASAAIQQACGWFAVTDTPRPADTSTTTHERDVVLVSGVPTVRWTSVPKSTQAINRATIDSQIAAALAELDALIAAPAVPTVPDGTLTTAQLSEAVRTMRTAIQQNRVGAQRVAATLKQTIRLVRNDLNGTN
jgi:hypothetical protein